MKNKTHKANTKKVVKLWRKLFSEDYIHATVHVYEKFSSISITRG